MPRARPAHSAAGFPHPHPDPRVGAASPRAPARSTSGQFSTEDGRWVPAAGGPGPRSPPLCHGPGPRPWGSRSCLRGAPAGARRVQGQAAPHAGGRWMSGRRGRGATSPGLDLDAGRVPQRDLLPRQAADGVRGQDGALRPEPPAVGLGREPAHPGAAGTSSAAHGKGRTCLAGRGQLAGKDSEGREAETRLPTGPSLSRHTQAPGASDHPQGARLLGAVQGDGAGVRPRLRRLFPSWGWHLGWKPGRPGGGPCRPDGVDGPAFAEPGHGPQDEERPLPRRVARGSGRPTTAAPRAPPHTPCSARRGRLL